MGLKVYKSSTGVRYNFLLNKGNGQQVMVMFRGSNKSFQTKDDELQSLIEATGYFKDGNIVVVSGTSDNEAKNVKSDPVVYTDVTEIQQAIDVLVEDFGVKKETLKTPAAVKKAAESAGAVFPNWKG